MPQRSKKPTKQAVSRASSAKATSQRSAAKPLVKGAKRSAGARVVATASKSKLPKPKARQPKAKILKPKAQKAKARQPKAKILKPKAQKAKPQPKAPVRAVRSLILPPKPKRLAARLLVARAPRTPHVVELPPDSDRPRLTPQIWQQLEAGAARLGQAPLRDEQRVAIRAALEGHDSLFVQPDEERSSACYQLAAQLLERPTVVVSPLSAALKAQSEALAQRKFAVVCVLAELSGPERSAALSRIARGGSLLVLLSPEALRAADVLQSLAKSGVALFAVEEAHCAADASHEVRPSYAELGKTLQSLGSPPVMAIAQVATRSIRREVCERLGLDAPLTIVSPPVRGNLRIVSKLSRGEGRQASLVRLIERLELPGLVFCATPHDVDSAYATLRGAGIAAHRHHSGMTAADRAAELSNFALPGYHSVMVAVSAFAPNSGLPGIGEQTEAAAGFGRGLGKRNLRFVVHYQSPASLEQYLREIHRAGADGQPAMCVLLHESSHRSLHEVMLAQLRFKATHLAELGRALETPALEGRSVTIEALALSTGQSRRTTDRLTSLLADAGVVSRTGGWLRVLCSAAELDEACRRLGAQLYALREQDARRLASVSAFAESSECKLSCLNQYLGEGMSDACGRCSACSSEILPVSQESIVPQASSRRPVVQEFSVQPVSAPRSGIVPNAAALTAKLADFEK